MNCSFRYITRQLFWPLILVVLVTSGVIWMSQSLRFIDLVMNRGLPSYYLFYLAFLVLPMYTSVFMPILLFGTVLFTYSRMVMDSEIVIWRSCGMSQLALAKPALAVALLVMAVCYALNLYYMPKSYREFKDLQNAIRNNYSQVLLREGAFNDLGDGKTVYVRERAPNGELLGILVYDASKSGPPVTMMAERGALVHTAEGPRVVMVNGNRQTVNPETHKLSILYFDRYTIDLEGKEGDMGPRWREPRERYLNELFWPSETGPLAQSDYDYRFKLEAEGHQRLSSPWLAIAFTLIALTALLTGDFNRRGQAKRILAAIIAMVILQSVNVALFSLAASSPGVVPLMYAVPATVILGCLWLLTHRRRAIGAHVSELAARV